MARIARLHPMQVLLASLLALAAVGSARAQQATMDAAAAEMGQAISHAKAKTVVVFDFAGPGEKVTAMGEKLADDFAAALAKSGGKFQVEDRSHIVESFRENDFAPGAVQDPDMAFWLTKELGDEALVWGNLSQEGDEIQIALNSYRVDKQKKIGSFEIRLPITDEMKVLINKNLNDDLWPNLAEAGKNGYSIPSCLQCPYAPFSDEAVRRKRGGTVSLLVIVGENGQAKDIKVLKAVPYGLTRSAVEAVRSWEFKPATDPTGKPSEVKQLVEASFNLYRGP